MKGLILIPIFIATTLSLSLVSCQKKTTLPTRANVSSAPSKEIIHGSKLAITSDGLSQISAVIKTGHGNIHIKFRPREAPNSVTRIIELIKSGFYDGLTFHRVVPNYLIQAGDPTGTGSGGSGKKLKAEFSNLKHERGTVALAREQGVDTADSQFYITLTTISQLDNKYTVIGKVTKGIKILDRVVQGDKIISISLSDNKNP